jgi:hypothetical protein
MKGCEYEQGIAHRRFHPGHHSFLLKLKEFMHSITYSEAFRNDAEGFEAQSIRAIQNKPARHCSE